MRSDTIRELMGNFREDLLRQTTFGPSEIETITQVLRRTLNETTPEETALGAVQMKELCDKEIGERFIKAHEKPPITRPATAESITEPLWKAKSDKVGTGFVLIPLYSLLAIGKIFIEGLRYGRDNWKKGVADKEYQEERLEHAFLHLIKWKEGDRSEAHLAKVAWFCVTQLELERLENEINQSTRKENPLKDN